MRKLFSLALVGAILAPFTPVTSGRSPSQAIANGLYGEYFDNLDFVTPPSPGTRVDAMINFNWGSTASPGPDALPPGITADDTWSARWSGLVVAPTTGTYLFQTTTADGVRLWVGGTLLIDRWRDQPALAWTGTMDLVGGQAYSIRMDYYQNTSLAQAQLTWQPPGASGLTLIPQSQLEAQVDSPGILPAQGTFTDSVIVSLAVNAAGAEIHYTLDGSAPTLGSPLYSGPFVLGTTATVTAQAYRSGTLLADSAPTSATFTITDVTPPRVLSVVALSATQVLVRFSEAVEPTSAGTAGNYSLAAGATLVPVSSATLLSDPRMVLLTVGALTSGTTYTLSVSNVTDLATPTANPIRANFTKLFTFIAPPGAPCLTNEWDFDEGTGTTTADSKGTNNGTLTNGTAWIPDGAVRSALRFDGQDDSVLLGSSLQPILGGTATLTAWVRTTGQGNIPIRAPGIAGAVTAPSGITASSNDIFWGWLDETGRIGIVAGQTNDAALSPAPSPPDPQPGAHSSNPINDGQWHHVVLTRDSTTGVVQVYVDGLLSGSGVSGSGVTSTPFQSLGRIEGAEGTEQHLVSFPGDLDQLKIYDCILSASEIQTLVNQAPVVNAGPTQALPPGTLSTNLAGTVSDDGLPTTGALSSSWSVVSGPGTVTLGDMNSPATSASFSTAGVYVLRLTATDGQLTSSDDLLVGVGSGITVSPTSGLVTTNQGGTAAFSVVLDAAPMANVSVTFSTSDSSQGLVSSASSPVPSTSTALTFTPGNWNIPQLVTVTGVVAGGFRLDAFYSIIASPAQSTDPIYSGVVAGTVTLLNQNRYPPPPAPHVWSRCTGSAAGASDFPWRLFLALSAVFLALSRGRRPS